MNKDKGRCFHPEANSMTAHLSFPIRSLRRLTALAGLAVLGLLPGCNPTVNIATPKPVTIDVNIKADVTTRSDAPEKKNDEQHHSGSGPAESYGGGAKPQE
ncbi:MAG: hypothetical protein AAGK14_02985 [Verrucomicrobiota bacterium]